MVGDIVLIQDSDIFTKGNGWPVAQVVELFPSDDGLVRKVKLRVGNKQIGKSCEWICPVTKLALLVDAEINSQSYKFVPMDLYWKAIVCHDMPSVREYDWRCSVICSINFQMINIDKIYWICCM